MMDELRDMLCDELEKITKKGELSAGSLDVIDKLTHSIKSIDTIMAMEGRSHDDRSRNYSYERGSSYARRRDSMGRYSRDDARAELASELRSIEKDMHDDEAKRMIREWLRQVEG